MRKVLLALSAVAILAIGGSIFQTYRVTSELEQQKLQNEQQIALILLSQKVPSATLEGLTQIDKVYVAQVSIPDSSSHLYVFLGGRWLDLGEGKIGSE